MKVVKIPLDQIEQNENSRVIYKTVDLAELMMSMKKHGLQQPVGVRKLPNGNYDAVFGNRRILAAKKLDWAEIPAHILDIETDVDRDILGLIENMKRQNTSVAEDGRMFQSLIDRGLSASEIAARLDTTVTRVEGALEVLSGIPKEFHSKIVYGTPGASRVKMKDKIAASTAMAILNIKKNISLNREQTRQIMAYAAEKKPSVDLLSKIAPMVKSGVSIAEAIERVADLERVVISFYVPTKIVQRLEREDEAGRSIHQMIFDCVSEAKKFGVTKIKKQSGSFLKKDARTVANELEAAS